MGKFIFGHRNKVHIIDLAKTVKELKKACKSVRDIAATGASILFVGTKHQAQEIVKNEAVKCGANYVVSRWLGGTLTNFETIKKNIARLNDLEKMKSDGLMDKLPKKEISVLTKEMKKLSIALSGIKNMQSLPGLIFVVDPVNEKTVIEEARRLKIPVVAVCDTNSDPDTVDYCIPGNDDAIKSISLLVSVVADAVIEGKSAVKTEGVLPTAGGLSPSGVHGISAEEKFSSDDEISITEDKKIEKIEKQDEGTVPK
jgi:small subunit ribosomal protein S2